MNIFQTVKQSVSAGQAASFYGIKVLRNGMACCPFHDDKHPSMKIDERFYCFGCGEKGDVIDFVAKLHDENLLDAARRIVTDFHIETDASQGQSAKPPTKKLPAKRIRDEQVSDLAKKTMERYYDSLCRYAVMLRTAQRELAPSSPEEKWQPLFLLSLEHLTYVEYLLDVLFYAEWHEKLAIFQDCGKEIKELEERINEFVWGNPGSDTGTEKGTHKTTCTDVPAR